MRASVDFGRPGRLLLALLTPLILLGCDPVERGDEAWAAGDVDAAVAAWGEAEGLDAPHQQRLARALYKLDRQDEAAALIDAVPGTQRTAEGHLVAGLLAAAGGRLDVALAAFEEGMSVEATPELAVNVCTARLALETTAPTPLAACQRSVELAPLDPAAYLGLARAALAEGLRDASMEALHAAQKHAGEPPDETTAFYLAEVWAESGDFNRACQWAVRGDDVPQNRLSAGRWCAASGYIDRARDLLEPLAGAPAESGSALALPASALLLTMAVDEAAAMQEGAARELAVARARRWARAFPEVEGLGAGVRTDLGRLARLEGELEAAEAWWRGAISVAPGEPAPRLNLARSLELRGSLDEARDALEHSNAEPLDALALGMELARLELRAGQAGRSSDIARSVLAGCDEVESSECAATAAYLLARLTAAEDVNESLDLLSRAVALGGEVYIQAAGREPDLAPLRALVRYHEIMGFPNP